jgi:DNA polymerase III subunit gamma/tau
MSHLALARKWRPQRFEDVIGQRGVVETLKNAITSGRLAQAFIFAGPRGVGKTTTARILARALNCVTGPTPEPCGTCDACLEIAEGRDVDVFEIDGATYTGVDAVREVIVEPLGIAPMRDRYKVFIIDEVHRLSKNAFDALLKSIEEPPPYVKFMMATTELHAVPATIQSRAQVFELKTLPFAAIRDQLGRVMANEQIEVDEGALALVARSAEGSMRDALSALDQVLAFTSDRITSADVSTVLGLIGRDMQFDVVETVAREDAAAAFDLADAIVTAGFDLRIVCRELARLMRDIMVIKIDPGRLSDPEIAAEGERERLSAVAALFSREDVMRAFDLLSRTEYEVRGSSQPRHQFEMALVKWIHLRKLTPLSELIAGVEGGQGQATGVKPKVQIAPPPARTAPPPAPARPQPTAPKPVSTTPPPKSAGAPEPAPQAPATSSQTVASKSQADDGKSALLAALRERNRVFYSMVVAQAKSIELEGDSVVFTFAPVHKTLRLEFERQSGWIQELAKSAGPRPLKVVSREGAAAPAATVDPAAGRKAELTARAKAEPMVQSVLDVFGGTIEDVEEI